MAYKGKFHPTNRKKYKGDIDNIIYRSLWERKFMVYCDEEDDIVEWGSEELVVPYLSPLDRKRHRYFPDFYIKTKNGDKFMVEIKPKKYTRPPRPTKRVTKAYMHEVKELIIYLLRISLISNHLHEIHIQNSFHKTNYYSLPVIL